jgi:hypothetical protein
MVSLQLPRLAAATTYDAFPATFAGVGVDPAAGLAILLGTSPNELWGVNESDGATQYLVPLPGSHLPSSLAVDAADAGAYLADAATGTVDVYSALNGSFLAAFHPWSSGPVSGMLVAVDATHGLLYASDPASHVIAVLALPGGSLRGAIPIPGVTACALAADPPASSAFVTNCGSVGNVTQVSGPQLGRVGSVGVGPDPSALWVNSTGTVFVLDGSGTHIALLNVSSNGAFPSPGFPLSGGPARTLAVDDRDGLVAATGGATAGLAIYGVGNGTFDGLVSASAPSGAVTFDPLAGRFVAPEVYAGGVDEALVVAAPSAPTAVTATAGNQSLQVSWGPPGDPGAAPVSSYHLTVGPTSSGTRAAYNATVPSLSVGGLTNGLPYLVRVDASSADGTGPVAPGVVATPAGVPFPPTNLSVNLTGGTTALLTWLAPRVDDGAPVLGYRVTVSGGPGPQTLLVGPSGGAAVAGLAPGTAYRITVAAINSIGPGSPSAPATLTTPSAPAAAWTYAAIGGAIAIGVVAAVALNRRRRRREPTTSESSAD